MEQKQRNLKHSTVSDSVTPRTVAHQASLSMGFSRLEYWSALSFPSPGDLPDPGVKPTTLESPALAGIFFTTVPPGKPRSREMPLQLQCCSLHQDSFSERQEAQAQLGPDPPPCFL